MMSQNFHIYTYIVYVQSGLIEFPGAFKTYEQTSHTIMGISYTWNCIKKKYREERTCLYKLSNDLGGALKMKIDFSVPHESFDQR